jgi:membrane protein required for colicin V production
MESGGQAGLREARAGTMTGFDILVLIVVGVSALLAFARGFVREVLSMLALVFGVLAALWGLPVFRDGAREHIDPPWMADVVLVVVLFLVVYVGVRVLTGRIHEWVHDSEPLGMLDRSAGLLFGVARGFVILALGVLAVTSVARAELQPKFLTEARFYPLLALMGDSLKHLAPEATTAATGLARDASEAGNRMAAERAGQGATGTDSADSSVDGAPSSGQKAAADQAGRSGAPEDDAPALTTEAR